MYVVTWNNDAIKHQSLQIYPCLAAFLRWIRCIWHAFFSVSLSMVLKKNYVRLLLMIYLELNNKQNRKFRLLHRSFCSSFRMNISSCFIFIFFICLQNNSSYLFFSCTWRFCSPHRASFHYITLSNFLNCSQMQFNLAILFVFFRLCFLFVLLLLLLYSLSRSSIFLQFVTISKRLT